MTKLGKSVPLPNGRPANRVSPRAWESRFDDEDDFLPIPLDRELREWLAELVRATGAPPGVPVKSMLDAIRADDEAMHNLH